MNCDWGRHVQIKQIPGPPPSQQTLYYNGSTYQEATQVQQDQPKPGDMTVQFKDAKTGQVSQSILHADGTVASVRADNTVVDKDQLGYVRSVTGPKGTWQFQRDVNGDIERTTHIYVGANGQQVTEVMNRNGRELNPGMEYWYSREGMDGPRNPSLLPPRDPNKPSGYNVFVDSSGNRVMMNINVTADGTVRIEQNSPDNQYLVSYETPGQDRYRDNGSQYVYDHPGGSTEYVDKTSKESTAKIVRNGKEFALSSKDGALQFLPDGTVTQDHTKEQTRDYYLPNGVIATIGSDSQTQKPVCKEAQVPTKTGQFLSLKNGQNGISDLLIQSDGMVSATLTAADKSVVQAVFNPKDGSRSEKGANDKFWRVSDADGNFIGTALNPGQPAWKIGAAGIAAANGVSFDSNLWVAAKPSIGPSGELLLIGKGSKEGSTARLDLSGLSVESSNGVDTYRYSDKAQASFANGKLVSVSAANKTYKPEFANAENAEKAALTALIDEAGNRISPVPSGSNYFFEPKLGKFISQMSNNNGVQSMNIWDPASGTYSLQRSWQSSSGVQLGLNVAMNDKNQVLQVSLPGGQTLKVPGNADIKSASLDSNTGALTMAMADGKVASFNVDGSYDWTAPGSSEQSHYNRDLYLVPNQSQGRALQAEASALGAEASDEALQKFARSILARFPANTDSSASIAAFLGELNQNYLSRLNPAVFVSAKQTGDKQIAVSVRIGNGTKVVSKTVNYNLA